MIRSCIIATFITVYLLSRRSRQRERLHATGLSICSSVSLFVCLSALSPNCKNAIFSKTKQFRAILATYNRKSYMGFSKKSIIGPIKFKMAEIRHLENRHGVIFFCRGWSDLDIILQTGAKWHVDCGDMVEIETRCRIPIWRTFGRIQWHIILDPPATLQGAVSWRNLCHDSWSCHIAGYKNSICLIENRFRHILFF